MPTLEDVPSVPEPKTCASCGRTIEWRRKWARSWDDVKYCSDACRRHKVTDTDRALETSIRSLLDSRKGGATICPSEAAREVGGEDWRDLMATARRGRRGRGHPGREGRGPLHRQGADPGPSSPLTYRLSTSRPLARSPHSTSTTSAVAR